MVHILKRMRKLHELLWIRCGPGALILPKEVSKISMEFSAKIYGGHRGARKFWREILPRIKYRNPSIPIQITRHTDPAGPSLLHIYTTTASKPSSTPQSQSTTTTLDPSAPSHTIDIRDLPESSILESLVRHTGATELQPTAQELLEMREMAEQKERSEKDRVEVREKLLRERREAEMLRAARGEAVAAN